MVAAVVVVVVVLLIITTKKSLSLMLYEEMLRVFSCSSFPWWMRRRLSGVKVSEGVLPLVETVCLRSAICVGVCVYE